MFDKEHSARLTQLADHLDNDTLLLGRFDFNVLYLRDGILNTCGTVGCAIGEAGCMWKEQLGGPDDRGLWDNAMKFFGLTFSEMEHLFMPLDQDTERYGGAELTIYASRHEVAANIRAFLEIKAKDEMPEV